MKNMKIRTFKYIGIAAIAAISFTSCKKYLEDVQVNPNAPENVGPKVLLSNVEVATFNNYTSGNARRANILTQHIAGTQFQTQAIQQYIILEGDILSEWKVAYTGALVNAQIIIDKYGAANPYYDGIAKILKAMNLGLTTDMWGDIPNKEALQGLDLNITPHYDSQESVYNNIQQLLSEAIADLQKPLSANALVPAEDDYIYGGDAKKWIAASYVLKARYANRLSKRSPGQSATDALNYLASAYTNGFTDNGADLQAKFGAVAAESNQWAAFDGERKDYIKMGAFLVDKMKASSDPRLPFYAKPVNGNYVGADLANPDPTTSSGIGSYTSGFTLPLLSYAEAKFIEAECKLRNNDAPGAATAHNEAVKASVLAVTGASNAVYEAANATETGATISLSKIINQKYVALFTQVETWTDWRRTDLPALTPNPSASLPAIPRRLPTPVDERTYNPNATVITNLLTRTWFDQ